MQFRILGPLEVHDGDRRMALTGDKQRALLALLLIRANQAVSVEQLIDALWEERPPSNAAKTLQVHVSRLRKALGDAADDTSGLLVTRTHGYELRVSPDGVDSLRFERLVEEARARLSQGSLGQAASALEEALSLWRGAPLMEFAGRHYAELEIARLEELRVGAHEDLIEVKLALGHHRELISELESLISEHPYRERLRGQLMLALYRSERQADALQAYQDARNRLVSDLGIEPGERLRGLERSVLAQDEALAFIAQDVIAEVEDSGHDDFVGREREWQTLVTCLEEACAGRGRLVLLAGEPGIGKTRLAEELIGAASAIAPQARVLVGRCWEAGGAPAYWPWVQSLRMYVRTCGLEELRSDLAAGAPELAQIIPEVQRRLPEIPDPPVLDSELARFRLFDAAAEFLRNASARQPLVVVLDDLHLADAPSLLLLQFLARELGDMRLLILAAFRDVGPVPGESLQEMIGAVTRESATRRLRLTGLSQREVERYVQQSSPSPRGDELASALYLETEGNPLFVGEIVRLFHLESAAPDPGGRQTLTIPQTVQEVISRRLRLLSERCQNMLELGAVIGREFALHTLAAAADLAEDGLLELLDEATAEGVVSEVPGEPDRLRFSHVLIRDCAYDGLGRARRVQLHRRLLRTMELLYGEEPGTPLAELAHQAIAAHDFAKGVRYAWRAADQSLELLAYEEAARLYQTALDVPWRIGEEDRCELLLSLAEAHARAGQTDAAKATFISAADLARRLALPRALARAAAGYGGRLAWARAGDDEQMMRLLEEGLSGIGETDMDLRARLLARLAGALRDEPERERRDALSQEAVELARRAGSAATLAYALDGRAAAIVAHDTATELVMLGRELRSVAEQAGDPEKVVAGCVWSFHAHLFLGQTGPAEADLASAQRLAAELRQPVQLWLVSANEAMLTLATGRISQARELIEAGLGLGEHAQPHGAVPIYWFQRLTLADFVGGLDDIESALRDLVVRYPARVMFRCGAAYVEARLGRLNSARRTLHELAGDQFAALPVDQEWLFAMSLLAEVAAILGDPTSAAALYGLLLPWTELNAADVSEGIRGSVARYLGLLATTIGQHEDAANHFEHAIEANKRMGLAPWLAHTQRDYAQLLLAPGQPTDSNHALELIREAATTYRRLGMGGWAARADDVQRTLESASLR